YDPELHTAFVHACNACLSPLGLVQPPKEFSDLNYVMGTAGQRFQPILGGGEGLAADAPQGRGTAPGGAEASAGRASQPPPAAAPPTAAPGAQTPPAVGGGRAGGNSGGPNAGGAPPATPPAGGAGGGFVGTTVQGLPLL